MAGGLHACSAPDKIILTMAVSPRHPDLTPISPGSDEAVVLEHQRQRVQPPKMDQVVLLNDDYTPMEFVVLVLQEFFNKDRETATQIMLKIHLEGRGVCGVFTRDVAATKVDLVMQASHHHGHPLQCISEPVE
jgi:ATP-dependent Clp protease adaptor protein ClpS